MYPPKSGTATASAAISTNSWTTSFADITGAPARAGPRSSRSQGSRPPRGRWRHQQSYVAVLRRGEGVGFIGKAARGAVPIGGADDASAPGRKQDHQREEHDGSGDIENILHPGFSWSHWGTATSRVALHGVCVTAVGNTRHFHAVVTRSAVFSRFVHAKPRGADP